MKCNICRQKFEDFYELTKHLINSHSYDMDRLIEYYSYSFETGKAICPICGKNFTISSRKIYNYKKRVSKVIGCCSSCSSKLLYLIYGSPLNKKEIQKKKEETTLKRYGVKYPSQSTDILNKQKETNLKKYGVFFVSQSPEVREKIRQTSIRKYGFPSNLSSPEIRKRIKETNLKKYGVEFPSQSPEVQNKMKEARRRD